VLRGLFFGQVTTGPVPFGTSGGGPFDSINLANLNTTLRVPIITKPGRGVPFFYVLDYESSIWSPVLVNGLKTWQPTINWGWSGETDTVTGGAYYTYALSTNICPGTGLKYSIFTWVAYVDRLGVRHPFNFTTDYCSQLNNSGYSTDGSKYYMSVAYAVPSFRITVSTPQGQSVTNVPADGGLTPATFTDNNGNQISTADGSTFVDTLNTTVLAITGAPPQMIYTYTGPSGTAKVTVNYTQKTVQTSFGCTGSSFVAEYPATQINLIHDISYDDGSQYVFQYESTPNTQIGAVTGRLASVTLPTGGTITYTYIGGTNGITCADGSASGVTRVLTPGGTWLYSRAQVSGAEWTTTVTDPNLDQKVLTFQGLYQTESQMYQGSVGPNALETIITCYNSNLSSCNTTPVTLPITRQTITKELPGGQAKTDFFYNNNLATESDVYDFGKTGPGPLLQKTTISYGSYNTGTGLCVGLGNGIIDKPCSVTVTDGGGHTRAQTTYTYDEANTLTTTTGTPQHTSITGSRGNATTVSNLVVGTTVLTKKYTYYDTGNVKTATDMNDAVTTYIYPDPTSTCGNSFPTEVDLPQPPVLPVSLKTYATWDCNGAVTKVATDVNGNTITTKFNDYSNPFWRASSITDQLQNVRSITYPDFQSVEHVLSFNGGASSTDVRLKTDPFGRPELTQQRQSPTSSTFDSTETDYDSLGRVSKTSLPYAGSAGTTCAGSCPGSSRAYDSLGRTIKITDGAGGDISLNYSANNSPNNNDILIAIEPAPIGENTKQRQMEYNGLSQLTSVCEITSSGGSTACGQNTPQNGYWTSYGYDAVGNLLSVSETASSSVESRTYSYDLLGRLTSETNPETGVTQYFYDKDPGTVGTLCSGTFNGDLIKKYDAVGNTTCYTYDAIHRVTTITYPGGAYSGNTPSRYFIYDSGTLQGQAMANAKGRLVEAYTTSKATDLFFSYSARGEVNAVYESTPNSAGYFQLNANYWPNGGLFTLSGLTGIPTITYGASDGSGLDGEGRITKVTAASGQNPVGSVTYTTTGSQPIGSITQVSYGSSDYDAFSYDQNTGRMKQYQFFMGNPAKSDTGNLTWNLNGSLQSLVINDQFPASIDSENCTYSYDDISRISSVNCGTAWNQTFSFDPFGNISKNATVGTAFTPTYTSAPPTNRYSTVPSCTPNPTYDANGSATWDCLHSYSWDAAGNPLMIDNTGFIYDALGRMVEISNAGVHTQVVYAPSGQKIGLMNGISALQKGIIPLPGGGTAIYKGSSGLSHYRHGDWLGSARLSTTPSRTLYYDTAYGPYGETYAAVIGNGGNTSVSFTGNGKDTPTDLYPFMYREYNSAQSRWISPDPGGLAVVDPSDPQTWNKYGYVENQPCNSVDQLGLDTCNFNVQINNLANLTSSQINTVQQTLQQVFGATTSSGGDSVGVTFDSGAKADATVDISNASSLTNTVLSLFGLLDVPFGAEGGWTTTPTVYWNNLLQYNGGQTNVVNATSVIGDVGAHEIAHNFGLGHVKYDSKNPNIMAFYGAPQTTQLDAVSNPNSKIWRFSPGQIGELFQACKMKHPNSGGGGANGNGMSPGDNMGGPPCTGLPGEAPGTGCGGFGAIGPGGGGPGPGGCSGGFFGCETY